MVVHLAKTRSFIAKLFSIIFETRLSQASAALSYYLTMTFFPLLITAYALLGKSMNSLMQLLELAERLVSPAVMRLIKDFISYVDTSGSALMLPLGLAVLISYASTAIRSMHSTIGNIQGGAEYKGISALIASIIYSLVLIALLYFAILIMLLGKTLVRGLGSGLYLSYLLLWGLLFTLIMGLFHVPKRREDKYSVLPGAVLSSLAMVLIIPAFSFFMGKSVRYSLVYGSIASLILLMLWIYMCCFVLYLGAAFNVAFYSIKKEEAH